MDIKALVFILIAVLAGGAKADAGFFTEGEYVGGIHGAADACKEIMPEAVEAGREYVLSRLKEKGFDWEAFTGSDDYKKAYQETMERILSLSVADRKSSCDRNWGNYPPKPAARATPSQGTRR